MAAKNHSWNWSWSGEELASLEDTLSSNAFMESFPSIFVRSSRPARSLINKLFVVIVIEVNFKLTKNLHANILKVSSCLQEL